jgi:hypothetical protein
MPRCTCVIKTAPTYDVYVQILCGIHRNMLEDALERQKEELEAIRLNETGEAKAKEGTRG